MTKKSARKSPFIHTIKDYGLTIRELRRSYFS